MLRNCLNRFHNEEAGLVDKRWGRRVDINACIFYCDLCSASTPGTVEYIKLICVLCDGLGHLLQVVNSLLFRLHKATCLLLHPQPVMINDIMPDILKDIMEPDKDMCSYGPDVVSIFASSHTNNSNSTRQSNFLITANLSHEHLNYDSTYYSDFGTSHPQSNARSIDSHISDDKIIEAVFRHGQNDNGFTQHNDYQLSKTNKNAHSQSSIRSSEAESKIYLHYRKADHTKHRKFHITSLNSSNHRCNEINKRDQKCFTVDSLVTQNPSSSRSHPRNVDISRDRTPELQPCDQEQLLSNTECELTRDIVLALRTVGDNLNTRIRFHNETSIQAVFATTKISPGQLILTTLKQPKIVGVITSLSLELAQLYNRL